jgi:hypothetical protein
MHSAAAAATAAAFRVRCCSDRVQNLHFSYLFVAQSICMQHVYLAVVCSGSFGLLLTLPPAAALYLMMLQ